MQALPSGYFRDCQWVRSSERQDVVRESLADFPTSLCIHAEIRGISRAWLVWFWRFLIHNLHVVSKAKWVHIGLNSSLPAGNSALDNMHYPEALIIDQRGKVFTRLLLAGKRVGPCEGWWQEVRAPIKAFVVLTCGPPFLHKPAPPISTAN